MLSLSCSAKNGLWVIIRSAISESTRGDALKPAVEEADAPGAGEAEAPCRGLDEALPPGEPEGDLIAATARMVNLRVFWDCKTSLSIK